MNAKIAELMEQIQSCDEISRRNAITDIGLILEMHSWKLSRNERFDNYEDLLSSDLIELSLNEADIFEITTCLQEKIEEKNKDSGSLVSAIGYASARSGLLPLVKSLKSSIRNFDLDNFNQALISLERILFFEDSLSHSEKKDIILNNELMNEIAKKMLSEIPISHIFLTNTYIRVMSRLVLLVFEEEDNDQLKQ